MPDTKPQILCLDDRVENLRIRKMLLEQFGCDVVAIADAQECLRVATSVKFDLILLDYHLGSAINGEDLARDLHSCMPEIPLIMLTGDPNIPESAKQCVDAVLIKGVSNPGDLLRTIQGLLPEYDLRAMHESVISTIFPASRPAEGRGLAASRKPNGAERQERLRPFPSESRRKG